MAATSTTPAPSLYDREAEDATKWILDQLDAAPRDAWPSLIEGRVRTAMKEALNITAGKVQGLAASIVMAKR